jgi:hypothetical protein
MGAAGGSNGSVPRNGEMGAGAGTTTAQGGTATLPRGGATTAVVWEPRGVVAEQGAGPPGNPPANKPLSGLAIHSEPAVTVTLITVPGRRRRVGRGSVNDPFWFWMRRSPLFRGGVFCRPPQIAVIPASFQAVPRP